MKKAVSILLSITLLITSLCFAAFAQESKPFYVVLGDSIAYGSGLMNPKDACYGKIVSDTNGYDYANHAIPGHTTTNLLNRLEEDAVIADIEKADIISISIGGNDFLMSNLFGLMFDAIVKSDYTQFDAIGESFYANFCRIVDRINALNADAVILMQTLYNPQSGYLRAAYQAGADRINAAIARYNEAYPGEIVIVDVGTALSDTMDNFASDDIHPSTLGNEKIAVAILEKLDEIELGENTQPVINTKGTDIQIPEAFTKMFDIMGTVFHVLGVVYGFFAEIFGSIFA